MTRILIADDHAILRKGLIELLGSEIEGVVCGEARDGEEALAAARSREWDLVLLDLKMPGRSGLDVLGELKRTQPNLPVLVLSLYPEDQLGERALKAGASGYMNKGRAAAELVKAIREVLERGRYVSPALAASLAPRS